MRTASLDLEYLRDFVAGITPDKHEGDAERVRALIADEIAALVAAQEESPLGGKNPKFSLQSIEQLLNVNVATEGLASVPGFFPAVRANLMSHYPGLTFIVDHERGGVHSADHYHLQLWWMYDNMRRSAAQALADKRFDTLRIESGERWRKWGEGVRQRVSAALNFERYESSYDDKPETETFTITRDLWEHLRSLILYNRPRD